MYMCIVCLCVYLCVCIHFNELVEITSNQSFKGLLLQICFDDGVHFLSSTDMHEVSCNYQNVSITAHNYNIL